ncbi:MAG: FCD domain-containing protein [Chitinivibrionales bacterium]|nr:FCD domain-containing protein [Chitinivibrionales bacterium]
MSTMHLPRLKKDNSLSQAVYQAISKEIARGKLRAGDKITEIGISQAMGISRAPVREALKRLAQEHLITLTPRSGCHVADMAPDEIEEIYDIRVKLECMALEKALGRFKVEKIQLFKEKFEELHNVATRRQAEKEIDLDAQLHDMIAQVSGLKNVQRMLKSLWARTQLIRLREAERGYLPVDACKEHVSLLIAILKSDKRAAVKLLREHIEHTKKTVLEHLNNPG